MLKKIVVVGLVAALPLAASATPPPSGYGSLDKQLIFTPGVSLLFPVGDFDDQNDLGFGVGARLEYFVHPRVSLGANFSYLSFSDPDRPGSGPLVEGINFFSVGPVARLFLFEDARFNPYLRLAGGLYQSDDESNVGLQGGVGALYRLSEQVGLFAEGSTHFVFDHGVGAFSSTANFLGLTGGLALTIPTGKKAERVAQRPPAPARVPEPKREPPQKEVKKEAPRAEIILRSIYFDVDQADLREEAKAALDENARVLQAHPDLSIEIQANCDERGDVKYNQMLGQRRAEAARKYLAEKGIDAGRITVVNFGERRPVDTGSGESAWAKNRRVDFRATPR